MAINCVINDHDRFLAFISLSDDSLSTSINQSVYDLASLMGIKNQLYHVNTIPKKNYSMYKNKCIV